MNISVIIPMYNAQKTIVQALSGLETQTGKDFEVIVVDDGSADESARLVADYKSKSSLRISLIKQENAGPARARNRGVEQSRGKVIIFLDSDCIPPPNWVEAMARPLNEVIVGCNCGYKVKNDASLIARYVDCEIAKRHQGMVGKRIDTIGTYSASFVKDVFVNAGGFDTGYTTASAEDFDLAFKLRRLGLSLMFTGETFVYHYHPDSLKRYLRQQYTRGYWRVKMYLRNRDKIIRGDSYTGHEAQVQFILSSLAFVSLPLTALSPLSPAVGFLVLLLSNVPLGLWAIRRERKLLLLAPVLASLRSLAGTLGVYSYFFGRLRRGAPAT